MPSALRDIVSIFGIKSDMAKKIIPELYQALQKSAHPLPNNITDRFPQALNIDKLTQNLSLKHADSAHLMFVIQTYYVIIIQALAGSRLSAGDQHPATFDKKYFIKNGILNFDVPHRYQWHLNSVDTSEIVHQTTQFDYDTPPPDILKALYHDLIPRVVRHQLGEYYTPDWLAQFVLDRIGVQSNQRILDPTCGSGTFIILAYRQLCEMGIENSLSYVAGIDINSLACLSAKANLILNMPIPQQEIELPIYQADVLLNPPDIGKFDVIIGNPPWVNWETLAPDYRQSTITLWEKYGLFPHSGFESILGKGKKDLSLVLTYAVVDYYLKHTGKLSFVMTQSILKTGGAAEGFRRFDFPKHALYAEHVDDFSKLRLFSGAETKPIVLTLDSQPHDKTSYFLWNKSGKKTIRDNADYQIINQLTYAEFVAEPIHDLGSPWLTGKPKALKAVRKVLGQSDYQAHAGVYTGGANAVYWLEILEADGDQVRIKNIVRGAKRPVPQVEQWIESKFIFPLLRGRDVSRWQADPTVHVLIVQNPETRQGFDEDWLHDNYPLTFAYLKQFEPLLKRRATYKRYFRDDVPFYTMFDIGMYSFAPYKVVWHGFGKKRMEAVVVGSIDDKPIMSNQAMHPFIGLQDEDEAHYLAACLNSAPFEYAVLSHTQRGGKSFAQPGILKMLRLPKYKPNHSAHQELIALSRSAHQGTIDDDAIAQATAKVWDLTASELRELQVSLHNLVK